MVAGSNPAADTKTAENLIENYMAESEFTHCRCGAEAIYTVKGKKKAPDKKYLHSKCPNADDGRGYVYHELIAQQFEFYYKRTNWTVKEEIDGFRAYAGDSPSTTLFENEQAAWDALDLAMWNKAPEHWKEEDDDVEDLEDAENSTIENNKN